jgi:hypothetical protein
MTEQQQQSGTGANGTGGRYPSSQSSNSTGNKDSGGNKGSGNNNNNNNNNKAIKKKTARDRKKARNKLQKKEQPVDSFTSAIKDTGHLMYGIVIDPSAGNMAVQC